MTKDDEQVDELGRLAFRTAGQLRERMEALSFKPDGRKFRGLGDDVLGN
ncbi:hypothetical protein [Amycolatopsis thailandensis]